MGMTTCWPLLVLLLHLLLSSFRFDPSGITWFCLACEFDEHPRYPNDSSDYPHHVQQDDNTASTNQQDSKRSSRRWRHLQSASSSATEEEACGASEATDAEQQADASLMESWQGLQGRTALAPGSYKIPLYFHVIHKKDETNPISAQRLQCYMDYLNAAYKDSVFSFEFRETTYSYNTQWATEARVSSVETDFKSQLRRGGRESLNVYVVHSLPPPPGATEQLASWTGFAYLPNTNAARNGPKDGVVIAEIESRSDTEERRPNTLVHEVGHFLGLMHTHAGECDASKQGDAIDDTPASTGSRKTCSNNCCTGDNSDTCPLLPGLDPVDNYMSYAGDNLCRVRFTTGQLDRMRAQYELYRKPTETPAQQPIAPPPVCSGWNQVLGLCDPPSAAPVDDGSPSCGNSGKCEKSDDCCSGICSPFLCLGFFFPPRCSRLDWCALFRSLLGPIGDF